MFKSPLDNFHMVSTLGFSISHARYPVFEYTLTKKSIIIKNLLYYAIIHSDPKLEHVKPILPIMCEISQWALFNKLTEEETKTLKPLELWTSTCHMLKNQYTDDVIISKQLFAEVIFFLFFQNNTKKYKTLRKLLTIII